MLPPDSFLWSTKGGRLKGRPAQVMPPGTMETLVVVGNFDGVHLGHQGVLEFASGEAGANRLAPVVLTFEPHPRVVLASAVPETLTTLAEKTELIQGQFPAFGVWPISFTLELSRLSPREFAEKVLCHELRARVVLVGENFRFGAKRAGDFAALSVLGRELGFRAQAVPLFGDAEGPYSSSRVREALRRGDISEAERLLGRPPSFVGTVTRGDGRGRALGIPTANLEQVVHLLPADGVYAAWAVLPDGSRRGAVANLGPRPTVDRPRSLEVHVLDFEGDLYEKELRVELRAHLRGQRKFESLESLVAQIRSDIAEARTILAAP